MIIRPARPADAPAAAAVHCASWREAYRDVLPAALLTALTEEFRARQWLDWLAAGRDGLFVAEDPDWSVVGVLRVMRAEGTAAEGAASEIDLLHVLAPFRRRGVGRALLRAAALWAKKVQPGPVGLWVLHGNDKAARFYGRFGASAGRTRTDSLLGFAFEETAYLWASAEALCEAVG